MYPSTPPASDLSRSRLKALTKWIRDDLDLLVAREGPNVLRPDDVLILHETFVILRLATTITALDLRATGIHRAVQDIAGVATRWPSRLCDDCDKIIALWTAKFGPFKELHPFLYGRGGRLEGIASVTEYSREALLKRWSETCPDKLHPKRSHRLGDLGFRAGDWWINTLFAHHAGIIGFEAVEGGTTFDKHGAYALLLKDTGEVEATSEERFTYRVPQTDKGKFRLIAATPASRDPIRVLRSHSINSVWGPKAGVRYEGLFAVKGWSIRQARLTDTAGGEWKEGDIAFEVRLERKDLVPMEEVIKRPTATEVDDYSEYKRLRRMHREGKRKVLDASAQPVKMEPQLAIKAAPPILPPQPVTTGGAPKPMVRGSPGTSRKSMFRHPQFDLPEEHRHEQPDVISPRTIPPTDHFPLVPSKNSTLAVPARSSLRSHFLLGNASSPSGSQDRASPGTNPDISSGYTGTSTQSNIREVAPWIDFDVGLTLSSPSNDPPINRERIISQASNASSTKKKRKDPMSSPQKIAHHYGTDSPPISSRHRRKSGDFMDMTGYLSPGGPSKTKDTRKSIFVRGRNPMAKLFDGATSTEDEGDDYFDDATYEPEASSPDTPRPGRRTQRANSSDPTMRVHSPVPIRPFSPFSPFGMARRGAIYTDEDGYVQNTFPTMTVGRSEGVRSPTVPSDDPFVEIPLLRIPTSLPMSLKKFISQPRAAAPMGSGETTPSSPPSRDEQMEARKESMAAHRLRKAMGEMKGVEVKIAFRNPFSGLGSPVGRNKKREKDKDNRGGESDGSGGVAPHVVG